jgi:hypothetical protein
MGSIHPPQRVRRWTSSLLDMVRKAFLRSSSRANRISGIPAHGKGMRRAIEFGIAEQTIDSPHAPVSWALQTLRGVALLTAVTFVA